MPFTINFHNWIFSKIHQNKLIYNTCWEDPRCDRMLLDLKNDSEVVMITSAGCNALDYLLDNPAKINCIDMNYRQNALLELKLSGLQHLDHNSFFELFGKGHAKYAAHWYADKLRPTLSKDAQSYWDKYIKYFQGKGLRKSFYYRGTSGLLAYSITKLLKARKKIRQNLSALFQASSIEEQQQYFVYLEQTFFHPITKLLLNNHYTMTLAGVPKNQQQLIQQTYADGIAEYIRDCFKQTFSTLDISENYFYRVYVDGSYSKDCCPSYLRQHNFDLLSNRATRINTYTTTISDFLIQHPGAYSHFILLDHQDWLAANEPAALIQEWELILKNSQPGTKILLRSAAKEINFFPDFIQDRIKFEKTATESVHKLDRVGTYASVYLGIVQ